MRSKAEGEMGGRNDELEERVEERGRARGDVRGGK